MDKKNSYTAMDDQPLRRPHKGILMINSGISQLNGMRLLRGAKDEEGFGRATTFVRDIRHLHDGQEIFVEGEVDIFGQNGPILIITDACAAVAGFELTAAVSGRRSTKHSARSKNSIRKSGKKSTRKLSKKKSAKRTAKSGKKRSSASKNRSR